jgi:hypothetical protein
MNPPSPADLALHLLHGWWIASCPACGFEFARRRSQQCAEQAAAGRRCPICHPTTRTRRRSRPAAAARPSQ